MITTNEIIRQIRTKGPKVSQNNINKSIQAFAHYIYEPNGRGSKRVIDDYIKEFKEDGFSFSGLIKREEKKAHQNSDKMVQYVNKMNVSFGKRDLNEVTHALKYVIDNNFSDDSIEIINMFIAGVDDRLKGLRDYIGVAGGRLQVIRNDLINHINEKNVKSKSEIHKIIDEKYELEKNIEYTTEQERFFTTIKEELSKLYKLKRENKLIVDALTTFKNRKMNNKNNQDNI